MELFTIQNLSFTYPEAVRPALQDISFSVEEGDFITLCGKSGCGKSTLLRRMKPPIAPHGTVSGSLLFRGVPVESLSLREQASKIGFVMQNPDNQIVTDKVWHELAFGLESLGEDQQTIRLRVAEMASFFGIQAWFYRSVNELSGGQKQLLNLAAVMAMQPEVLILDEPTSMLDPIAASDFLETVKKINSELGTTVIMSEHRLEEVLPLSDRVIVMDGGRIFDDGEPRGVCMRLAESKHEMFFAMPSPVRIFAGANGSGNAPLTVREGREWLNQFGTQQSLPLPETKNSPKTQTVLKLKDVWFRYNKNDEDVIKGLSAEIHKGEIFSIAGGNGTGKTTALSLISGVKRPYRGKIEYHGSRMSVLPQNPQALFVKNTVEQDLRSALIDSADITEIVRLTQIEPLLTMHPFDLSGGEQQRAALAKILLAKPDLLLLDEPTKGLDGFFKETLAQILHALTQSGATIVMVSHDIEFCAKFSDTCALLFDGSIITSAPPRQFFAGNSFYTTAANRMSRHVFAGAITVEEVVQQCKNKSEN